MPYAAPVNKKIDRPIADDQYIEINVFRENLRGGDYQNIALV